MVIIACGSRDWTDEAVVLNTLDRLNPHVVIEGECRGADTIVRDICLRNGVDVVRCPADWLYFGKAAGPARNEEMLQKLLAHPDPVKAVVAFTDSYETSRGTRHMCTIATHAGIDVYRFDSVGNCYFVPGRSGL